MKQVKRTGRATTMDAWNGSGLDLSNYLQVGDFCDEGLYGFFLEVLPPAHYNNTIVQIGEASDHGGPDGRARYSTIQRAGLLWVYTGQRCLRERVEIV